jgi:hypothetical protein
MSNQENNPLPTFSFTHSPFERQELVGEAKQEVKNQNYRILEEVKMGGI